VEADKIVEIVQKRRP